MSAAVATPRGTIAARAARVPSGSRPRWRFPEVAAVTAHPRGRWRVRIGGETYYLTTWLDDAEGTDALAQIRAIKGHAERGTPIAPANLTAAQALGPMLDAWLDAFAKRVDMGDASPHTLRGYRECAKWLRETIPPTTPTLALGANHGRALLDSIAQHAPTTRANRVRCAKVFLRWASRETGFGALSLGEDFRLPPQLAMRRHRREKIKGQYFRPAEIRALLAAADPMMRALVLLAVNCGNDGAASAALRTDAIEWARGLLIQPRGKTEIQRCAPLWPETLDALRAVWPVRPGLVFATARGRALVHSNGVSSTSAIAPRFRALREAAGVRALGFRALKRSFATAAAVSPDDLSRRLIVGHRADGVSELYIAGEPVARVRALSDRVREWVFGAEDAGGESEAIGGIQ